jgi:hypothetical protein
MLMEGKLTIKAPIQKLWDTLLDPETLLSCIPGAEKIERIDEKTFDCVVKQKVGPISVKFKFKSVLSKVEPPTHIEVDGEGEDIGEKKVLVAHRKLSKLNPEVEIIPVFARITEENVFSIISGVQVVLDGLDNFNTRLLVNSACVKHRIPYIHGGVARFRGLITTILPGKTPCLACVYPEGPPGGEGLGVLGVIPGLIANIQALEAIKIMIGHGPSLAGKLLRFNGNDVKFRVYDMKRNESCKVCSLGLN